MSVDDYSAEAKRVIAKAIENAVKHITSGLQAEVAGKDGDNKEMAEYWPLGSQADEETGLLAIEAFIKARVMLIVSCLIYPPTYTFAHRSGREVVNGNISSSTWARQRTNYILKFDGVFQQDVSQYPEQPLQFTLHYGYIIRY